MKRILLSFAASMLIAGGATAQSKVTTKAHTVAEGRTAIGPDAQRPGTSNKMKKSSAVTIWSEDFSGGIPMGWTNQGYDVDPATGSLTPNPLCQWEYRGPNTTPSNATGSRGAFAAGTFAIASPTASNGFIIFDSDYQDNNGTPGAVGNSPAPHIGTLTTSSIDLTGYPFVQISMSSQLRQYSSRYFVAISTDGGTTFTDTAEFGQNVALNTQSANPETYTADISAAGNQSNVVLQFIFDGTPSVNTANGPAWAYYYWQIDDVEITELPANSFKFVDLDNAPAKDVIYPADHPRYGNAQVDQAMMLPVNFDANILNFGSADQTNVRLVVEIQDNGSVVSTLQSPALPLLAAGDTGTFADFTTATAWTPNAVGNYDAVFYVTSDSANAETPYDTIAIDVNALEHATHFGSLDNVIGVGNNVLGLAQAFTFPADVDTAGYFAVTGLSMYISTVSDTTGSLIVEIYDTAGFSYGAGGGPAGSPFTVRSFPLNANNIGQTSLIDMTNPSTGAPLFLQANRGYLVVVNLVTTSGDIRIGNDQTVETPTGLIGMLFNDGNWYSGFSNSSSLSNLIINWVLTDDFSIGLDEALALQNSISLFPNPSNTGIVSLEMDFGGTYEIEVTTLTGQRVHAETVTVNGGEILERDFSNFESGAYLVNFTSENIQTTKKLIIK